MLSSDAALIQLKMLCIVRGGSENVAKRYEIAILFSFLKVSKEKVVIKWILMLTKEGGKRSIGNILF